MKQLISMLVSLLTECDVIDTYRGALEVFIAQLENINFLLFSFEMVLTIGNDGRNVL